MASYERVRLASAGQAYSRRMTNTPKRTTVDLSAYPDLVVIYLGMRVEEPRGYETLLVLHPQIQATVESGPDGCCCMRHSLTRRSRCT